MTNENGREDGGRSVHVPVLPAEVLEYLRPVQGGRYLDGTLGLGGHAGMVLERAEGAELLGLDRDPEALALAGRALEPFGARAHLRLGRYSRFASFMDELGWDGLDGALLDLGVSSLQLDRPERGFSFLGQGPLDMRMGAEDGLAPASSLVNRASVDQLKEIIRDLGEEPMAGRIARAIERARVEKPIETTRELAAIVEQAYPAKWRRTSRNHPATRTFQALRMAVNQELEELGDFLRDIVPWLKVGGRVVIISFHSLEDRLVKYSFRNGAKGCICPPSQPMCTCDGKPRLRILTKKPVSPGEDEMESNPRSRSAKLRAAEKLTYDT